MVNAEDYKVEIIKDKEDGRYLAHIPQLDLWGDGETVQVAYEDVISVVEDVLELAKKDKINIPDPE